MTTLKFRNLTASTDDPVETWPFEGILAAVERGTLPDWRRLAKAIQADPWGPVAQQVLEAVHLAEPYGTTELLEGVVGRARKLAKDAERREVAALAASGISTAVPMTAAIRASLLSGLISILFKTAGDGVAGRSTAPSAWGRRLATVKTR